MTDRVVVLRPDDAIAFLADSCAALADALNQVRVVRSGDAALVDVYAEVVLAHSRLVRRRLDNDRESTAQVNIIEHLEERLRQARAGEITVAVLDIVDRLHAEITREPAGV